MTIPEHLSWEIRQGNCVAFIGAGFSAAAAPHGDLNLRSVVPNDAR